MLLAVLSPVCCCQAAGIAGLGCEAEKVERGPAARADASVAAGCKTGCCGAAQRATTPRAEGSAPSLPEPEPCTTCPQCRGFATSAGSGLAGEVKVSLPQSLFAVEAFDLPAVVWPWMEPAASPLPMSRAADRCVTRTGRSVLRWCCALIV